MALLEATVSDPGPGRFHVHFRVPSDLRYTDLFHTVLAQLAREVPIPEERMDWVTLALREAVNNAVLHGNKQDPSKFIEVELEATQDEFIMRVWDDGPGFDDSKLGDPRSPENLFRPNGRGIFLIRQLLDRAKFVRKGGRFGLEMAITLGEQDRLKDNQEAVHD